MSEPAMRELLDDLCLCAEKGCGCVESRLTARVEAVLALHSSTGGYACEECQTHLPCQTLRLLNRGAK
jgi:hypothetical protein